MKPLYLLLSLLFGQTLLAQKPVFKPLRYDDDFSYLRTDTSNNWYNKLKFTPLSLRTNTYVSFGGDVRYQYFYYKNEDWGDATKDPNGFILTRYLVHADVHSGKRFRLFTQLQSSFVNDKASGASPVDDNALELHQAFADVYVGKGFTTRLGRQELSFGSQRLVSVREAPNNRQSFDAGRLLYRSGKLQADAFFAYYVAARKGILNDKPLNKDTKFWGAYFTLNQLPVVHNIDLYYLGIDKTKAIFDDATGKETRHSVGTRLWYKNKTWMYDVEGVYQWGHVSNNSIRAWTASANVSYTFQHTALQPQVGIKTEMISGDHQYNDNRINTFNPLFPRGAYFGLAALIGPANLQDVHPYLQLQLSKTLSLQYDYDIFWRMQTTDGIYAPNVQLLYSGKNTYSKSIGRQLSTELVYTPNAFLYLRTELTWFNTGQYLKEVSAGKDILMAGATVQLRF